jgi:hypothetical protein
VAILLLIAVLNTKKFQTDLLQLNTEMYIFITPLTGRQNLQQWLKGKQCLIFMYEGKTLLA